MQYILTFLFLDYISSILLRLKNKELLKKVLYKAYR